MTFERNSTLFLIQILCLLSTGVVVAQQITEDIVVADNPIPISVGVVKEITGFCLDFNGDDNSNNVEGFAPCPGWLSDISVVHSAINTYNPKAGPTGVAPTDYYLHVKDEYGPSSACGTSSEIVGDWSSLTCKREQGSCYELCYDVQIFDDGCQGELHGGRCKKKTSGSDTYAEVIPAISIQGGAPNFYRAVWAPNDYITDPSGNRPGWHTICAPLGPLAPDDSLPSNADGSWLMTGAPCDYLGNTACSSSLPTPTNDAWCKLFSYVTAINVGVDIVGTDQEKAGYDNICIKEVKGCDTTCEPKPLCYWQYDMNCEGIKKLDGWYDIVQELKIKTFDNSTCPCNVIEQSCPDRCDMAEQELMALLLNIASGKLDLYCRFKRCDISKKTASVKTAIKKIEGYLASYPRNDYKCSKALEIATSINSGASLS